jgi:glycosyltransferase involved in cell wall biosynthesis
MINPKSLSTESKILLYSEIESANKSLLSEYINFFEFEWLLVTRFEFSRFKNNPTILDLVARHQLALILETVQSSEISQFQIKTKVIFYTLLNSDEDLANLEPTKITMSDFLLVNLQSCSLNSLQKIKNISCEKFYFFSERPLSCRTIDIIHDLKKIFSLEKEFFPIKNFRFIECSNKKYSKIRPLFFECHEEIQIQERNLATKFSIIIPFFNRTKYLKLVIFNLLKLDAPSNYFEIVLVDDGSSYSEKTELLDFLRKLETSISISYHYIGHDENTSKANRVGFCRNYGALKCNSENLIFLDSDIVLNRDFFSQIKKYSFENAILQMVRINLSESETDSVLEFRTHPIDFFNKWIPAKEGSGESGANNDIVTWAASFCWVLSLESFKKLGGFRLAFLSYGWEDIDFAFRANDQNILLVESEIPVIHLYTLSDSSEYKNNSAHRTAVLLEGAELFFRNTLSHRSAVFLREFIKKSLLFELIYPDLNLRDILQLKSKEESAELLNWFFQLNGFAMKIEDLSSSGGILRWSWLPEKLVKLKIKLKNPLVFKKWPDLLPTFILDQKELGIENVRTIYEFEEFRQVDDYLNFKYIRGWKFKSARLDDENWFAKSAGLIARRSDLTEVSLAFDFDSIIVEDRIAADELSKARLKNDVFVLILKTDSFVSDSIFDSDSATKIFEDPLLSVWKTI